MRIMGIDEGSRKAGIAVIDIDHSQRRLVYAAQVRLDKAPYSKMEAPERIYHLYDQTKAAIRSYAPDLVSLEHIRVNMGGRNMDAMLIVARAQSAVSIAAFECGVRSVEIMANQVRSCLGVKAKRRDEAKDAMREVVNKMFAEDLAQLGYLDGLVKSAEDVSDAIALALAGNYYGTRKS